MNLSAKLSAKLAERKRLGRVFRRKAGFRKPLLYPSELRGRCFYSEFGNINLDAYETKLPSVSFRYFRYRAIHERQLYENSFLCSEVF
jgi:hypothetical protein